MKKHVLVAIYRVQEKHRNPGKVRVWVCLHNDTDPTLEGEVVMSGMPAPAKDFNVGAVFETVLRFHTEDKNA